VTANNSDVLILRIGVLDLRHEAGSTNDIEGSDTEQTLGVVDALALEDLSDNGNSAVDRVRDNEDVGIRGRVCCSFGEVADDRGVGVEEVVAGHTWLAGNTGGDEDDLRAFEGSSESARCGVVAGDFALGVDVADVCSDTWRE